MMKLWIISDLHLEFADWQPSPPNADVCVVAGDVLTRGPEHSLEWLAQHIAPAMPVVAVAGNHEFYGGSYGFDLALQRARDLRLPDVHFLDDVQAMGIRLPSLSVAPAVPAAARIRRAPRPSTTPSPFS